MAVRARERQSQQVVVRRDAEINRWRRQEETRLQRRVEELAALPHEMTLAEAIETVEWAKGYWCACPGPPVCCWERTDFAKGLIDVAAYAATLMRLAAHRPTC